MAIPVRCAAARPVSMFIPRVSATRYQIAKILERLRPFVGRTPRSARGPLAPPSATTDCERAEAFLRSFSMKNPVQPADLRDYFLTRPLARTTQSAAPVHRTAGRQPGILSRKSRRSGCPPYSRLSPYSGVEPGPRRPRRGSRRAAVVECCGALDRSRYQRHSGHVGMAASMDAASLANSSGPGDPGCSRRGANTRGNADRSSRRRTGFRPGIGAPSAAKVTSAEAWSEGGGPARRCTVTLGGLVACPRNSAHEITFSRVCSSK